MTIQEKILTEARVQFNAQGLAGASAKSVAKALGISDGNLRYHYRTKADLVWALYQELVEKFNVGFALPEGRVPDMQAYWEMLGFTFQNLADYRFLMDDFAGIMRQYPRIHQHYRALQEQRRVQFAGLVRLWQQQGWLRTDLPDAQYQHFYGHLQTFHDFWLPEAFILYQGPPEGQMLHYRREAFAMLVPYLTPQGLDLWRRVDQG